MIIDNKDKMENIIQNNPNLKWDNWSVIAFKNEDGYYTKNGIFKDGKWMTQYRFDMIDYNTWNIPDKFLKEINV
jgi:hypothetical protein